MRARLVLVAGVAAIAAIAAIVAIVMRSGPDDAPGEPAPRMASGARLSAVERAPEAIQPTPPYDDDPAGALRLEGQVIAAGDEPVAGATVVIDANPPREVQTEADGAFAFDGLTPRTYRIAARAAGGTAGPVAVRLGVATEPVVLRIRAAARVAIAVRSDAGRPIPGALVELRDLVAITAVTDEMGTATLQGVGAGWHRVKASADGHASAFGELATTGEPGAEHRLELVLRAGASVAGTVVDSSGAPIEGARVLPEHVGHLIGEYDARYDSVITDAKGRWRLTGLPRHSMRIRAYHGAFAPGASSPLLLAEGDRSNVAIVLDRGGRVRGTVVDAAGAPVAGAEVRIAPDTVLSGEVRRVATDARGEFAMGGLPRGTLYAIAAADGATSQLRRLDLRGAEPRPIELRLDQQAAIAGVVVTAAGTPVGEARVVAEPDLSGRPDQRFVDRLRGAASVIAGIDGTFRIAGLEPGAYVVRAIRPGSSSALLSARLGAVVHTGASDARVVVDDLSAITGRIALPDGKPVPQFAIQLGTAPPRSFTADDGGFRVDEVPAGKQFVRITGPGIVTLALPDVAVDAARPTDLGTVTVQAGRAIRGTVVDGAGRPVAGATVAMSRELFGDGTSMVATWRARDAIQVVTGADGTFAIRGIGTTSQQIAADHDTAGRSVLTAIPPGTADLELALALRPTGALQGFVRVFGKPAEAVIVLRGVGAAANARFTVFTGPDGSYRFDRLAPDRYTHLTLQVQGSRNDAADGTSSQIEIRPGATLTHDVDLRPGGVTVVVTMASPNNAVKFGYGTIAVLEGTIRLTTLPTTVTAARSLATAADRFELREGLIVTDQQIAFANVRPGRHVVCVIPLRGDPRDPSVIAEAQQGTVDWPVYCEWLDVAPAPDPQRVTVEVQPLSR